MAGFSWPGDLGLFQAIAEKFFSDADESQLDPLAKQHKDLAESLEGLLQRGDNAYGDLEGAYQAGGKASDALGAVKERRTNFRKQAGALAAEALAAQKFMQPTAQVISDSKSADAKAGYDALKKAHETQYWPDWMLHTVGKETKVEEAKQQLEGQMSSNMNARVQKLQGTYKAPADGDYGFDGQPTSWDDSQLDGSVFKQAGQTENQLTTSQVKRAGQTENQPTGESYQRAGQTENQPTGESYQQAGQTENQPTGESYQQAGQGSGGGQGSSGGGSSGGTGSGGGAPGGNAGTPSGTAASTSLQSGAALAEHAAPAAPTSPAGAEGGRGGGVGAPPSIGGIGGGASGGGQAPRIGGISGGAGAGAEGPRTAAQSGGAGEKSSGSSGSSSGSGERQGSGLSRGGGAGAGAVGGETRAQSASAAGVREAMRGDTAGGASSLGQRAEDRTHALLGSVSNLSHTELQSAREASTLLQGALSGVEGALAQSHPARDVGLAGLIASGGFVADTGVAGFLPNGTWGRVAWPGTEPVPHPGLDGVGFVFADTRVEHNPEAGVFRPTTTRVTTTGSAGEVEPALRLPLGAKLLDRSQAPGSTGFLTDIGLLALGLGRWLLERGLDGDKSWRLVAVSFTKDPGEEAVGLLLQLPHPVEAFWPDRAGYEERLSDDERRAASSAAADAAVVEEAQRSDLALKAGDPLAHAQAAEKRAPNEPYTADGLPEKEAYWHRVCRENNRGALPTARRWVLELGERYKAERRGGEFNL